MSKKGKPAIREAIENAVPIPPPSLVPEHLAARYKMLETGLHRKGDDTLIWISAPFKIEAETIDEAGRWGC